jgi:hypothetical protein
LCLASPCARWVVLLFGDPAAAARGGKQCSGNTSIRHIRRARARERVGVLVLFPSPKVKSRYRSAVHYRGSAVFWGIARENGIEPNPPGSCKPRRKRTTRQELDIDLGRPGAFTSCEVFPAGLAAPETRSLCLCYPSLHRNALLCFALWRHAAGVAWHKKDPHRQRTTDRRHKSKISTDRTTDRTFRQEMCYAVRSQQRFPSSSLRSSHRCD